MKYQMITILGIESRQKQLENEHLTISNSNDFEQSQIWTKRKNIF